MRVEGADAYRTLGAVGMCVNGIFLTISSWRLVNAARVSEYHWRESRVVLHITLFTFAMLEFLYQVSIFATEKISAWGYTFHLLAVNANILSFCLVFIRWEKTLGLTRMKDRVDKLTKFIVAINVTVTIPSLVIVYIRGASEKYWEFLFVEAVVEACSLLFSTIWLFAYSVQLNERISRVISSNGTVNLCATTNSARNRGSVQNIVYVLFICSCTYLARVFCLTLLGIDIISGSNRTDRFTNVGWFVISNWIPTLIPGLLFLYTSRVVSSQAVIDRKRSLIDVFCNDVEDDMSDIDDIRSNPMYSTDRTLSTESFTGEMRRLQLSGNSSDPPGHYRSRDESKDEENSGADPLSDTDVSSIE